MNGGENTNDTETTYHNTLYSLVAAITKRRLSPCTTVITMLTCTEIYMHINYYVL